MRISIMQPTYLPWLGYFELIDNCDLFVLLDDVQFVKKSWHQRNRVKTPNRELMLTVPVLTKGKFRQLIKDACINNSLPWRNKHFVTINNNYKKASYYSEYIGSLKKIYDQNLVSLIKLNLKLIEFIKNSLGIKTEIALSSAFDVRGDRTEKIVNICKACKADVLYDAKGAQDILDLDLFQKNNIQIIFQEYEHPQYKQIHGDFIPYLSTLDLLFNEGPKSLDILRSGNKG
jgi:hypothetical protein